MTERDLYDRCIPMIAQIAVECRKMSKEDYEDFKRELMEACPEATRSFMRKVYVVIDSVVEMKGGAV